LIHGRKYKTEDTLKIQTIQKLNTILKKKTQQNKTTLIQSLLTTLGQETRWPYSTTIPSPQGATLSGWWHGVFPHSQWL